MTYELWIGDQIVCCTGNLKWLLSEGLPFHKRWSYNRPILITSRPSRG